MNPLSVLLPGFEGTELPEWVASRLADGMAGVCLFATNVGTPEQLRRLTDDIVRRGGRRRHAALPGRRLAIPRKRDPRSP